MTYHQTALNGITGFVASWLGVISTFQEQAEWWVRITGGLLGLMVASFTLYRLITNRPKQP